MKAPTLLLFDLGGVLIESSVFNQLGYLLPKDTEPHDIKARWLYSPTVRQFERGEISPETFARQLVEEWELSMSPADFLEFFGCWPRRFFPGAHETLQTLRQSYRVGCLSNSNPVHWQQFADFDAIFDVSLFSHLLGVIKPDPEIFLKALETCSVAPEEVMFFDDCQANVDAAKDLGIPAFLTDGFASLQATLKMTALL